MNLKSEFSLGGKLVGPGRPCFVIAEAGANHDRDLGQAKELIDAAAEAGADAVKFQTYTGKTLYSRKTPAFTYLKSMTKKNIVDLLEDISLPREWQKKLSDHARKKGILFFSSPFDFQAVAELAALNVPALKIASFELVDLELIAACAKTKIPVILSTGMAKLGEIEEALETITAQGNACAALLHCTSLYPAPAKLTNLRAMDTMSQAFRIPVGLSDHTTGITVPIAAAARGACLIEKHYTLSRKLKGPDHPFAIEPGELKDMVYGIREAGEALGTGIKDKNPEEAEMFSKARRSLIAARAIRKGTPITREMIIVKRPGFGIKPNQMSIVLGRPAKTDIAEDDIITWEMV